MNDCQLLERPSRGWTPWKDGNGDYKIEQVWWQARVLHFPKLNCSAWFDGSDHVGILLWGVHGDRWCMKRPPADWKPPPPRSDAEIDRIFKDWINPKRVARGLAPLPYLADVGAH